MNKQIASVVIKLSLPALVGLAVFAGAQSASAATLTLSPASQNVSVGETFTVNILLDTQGQAIDGVDIKYLNYNPYFLQLIDGDSVNTGTQITPGGLMPNTLTNTVDTQGGKVNYSQITNNNTQYTGSGVLASLTFKALVAGTAPVTIDFSSGNTKDANVASVGNDILTSVGNGSYVVSYGAVTPGGTPSGSPGGTPAGSGETGSGSSSGAMKLINDSGTYYLIIDGVRRGITNPGMLSSYGFSFSDAVAPTAADLAAPSGSLLTPSDGALVKSKEDPTVYLISGRQRYGFVSAAVFLGLGFNFKNVLVVTNPELQVLTKADNLANPNAAHLPGLDVNINGTVYWIGGGGLRYGYPSLEVYNSWHIDNDFSKVVKANAADLSLVDGGVVSLRTVVK